MTADTEALSVRDAAEELHTTRLQITALKGRAEALEAVIVADFPEVLGTYTQLYGNASIRVTRREKWTWDQDVLEAKLVTVPTPDWITVGYRPKQKAFAALSPEEQAEYSAALERSVSDPIVKVSFI